MTMMSSVLAFTSLLFTHVGVAAFEYLDLLTINGECAVDGMVYKDVVICLTSEQNYTLARVTTVTKIDEPLYRGYEYSHNSVVFPTNALRAFSIMRSKSRNQSLLSNKHRLKIERICNVVTSVTDAQSANISITFDEITILAFGMIAHRFGINGFWYGFNYFKEFTNKSQTFCDGFYEKYLRFEPRSLANSAIANRLSASDLVKIKELKRQKNDTLQITAQHFSGSFGEIIPFTFGNLMRTNSRNQTEFAIQSLFDQEMKLGLRPKYLLRVTKIYVHRVSQNFRFPEFREQVLLLLSDPNKEILYLPHKIPALVMDEFAILMLQQRDRQNLIHDIALTAINGIHMKHCLKCPIKFCLRLSSWEWIFGGESLKK